jgi:hypothetical protein
MHQLRMKHAFALMQQLESSEWPVSGGYVRDSAWASDVYTKWPPPRVVAPSAGISALVSAPYTVVRLNDVVCAVCDAASEADGEDEPDDEPPPPPPPPAAPPSAPRVARPPAKRSAAAVAVGAVPATAGGKKAKQQGSQAAAPRKKGGGGATRKAAATQAVGLQISPLPPGMIHPWVSREGGASAAPLAEEAAKVWEVLEGNGATGLFTHVSVGMGAGCRLLVALHAGCWVARLKVHERGACVTVMVQWASAMCPGACRRRAERVTMYVMPVCVVQVGWLVKVLQDSHPYASFKLKDEHLEDYNAQDLSRLSLFGGVKAGKDRQFVKPHLLIGTGHGFCTGGWCAGKVCVCSGRDVGTGTMFVITLLWGACGCCMHVVRGSRDVCGSGHALH